MSTTFTVSHILPPLSRLAMSSLRETCKKSSFVQPSHDSPGKGATVEFTPFIWDTMIPICSRSGGDCDRKARGDGTEVWEGGYYSDIGMWRVSAVSGVGR